MPKKKAMIEVQFNWIFILIAGIIILMFFIGITSWYKDNEERRIAGDVLTKIRTILINSELNSRAASELEVPNIEFIFTCDPDECGNYGCASTMMFEGTGIHEDTPIDIIFSPDNIKSDFINVWALEWKTPYKVTNFLYITSPAVKYVLVYKEDQVYSKNLATSVYDKMKENEYIEKNIRLVEESNVDQIVYNNEYLVRFVWFYNPDFVEFSPSIKKGSRDAIKIIGDETSGEVTFSSVSGNTLVFDTNKRYSYIGLPSLIGAIYSEDFDNYECNMKKAFLRMRSVNEIYLRRSMALEKAFFGDMRCEFYYDYDLQSYFNQIDLKTENLESGALESSLYEIEDAIKNIETINSQTELKTCPRIY